jgi:uncharacterized protein YggE
MQKTLVITGQGVLKVTPDLVIISFPVECRHGSYAKAIDKLNVAVAQLRTAIESSGLDPMELKTTDFRVQTETRWNKQSEKHEFDSFKARHDLKIELPMDAKLINNVIARLSCLGQNLDFRINFGVKDKESCLESLIQGAVSNAIKKAKIIAAASGITLKDILNINYSFKNIYFQSETSLEYQNDFVAEAQYSMPEISPSDIELNEPITITWSIES